MNVTLQRHCARYIYVIPDGLRELMSDISREVLRSQPEDTYTFIADYLDALLITRENARVAARLVQSLTEMAVTTATFLEETGMPRDEIDNIVGAIQKTFRKSIDSDEEVKENVDETQIVLDILNEIQVSQEKAEIAAIIIQQAYKRFKERKEREKLLLAGMVDWRVAARSAIQLYRKTGVTNEEANRAATLIKAAYKGYYTRKLMKQMSPTCESIDFWDHFDALDEEYYGEEDYQELFDVDSEKDERSRSVKIDYNTVIPHVDFDTEVSNAPASDGPIKSQLSTPSTIAKHSLRMIFDAAFSAIEKQATIPEERESSSAVLADLADTNNGVFELKLTSSEAKQSGEVDFNKKLISESQEPSSSAIENKNLSKIFEKGRMEGEG
ncbi:uncharacterized protein LOC126737026 [Anthonomus grandis grandis]|uniref:uncharacterized protein LOC126737026 n=1 Tax=Anthonomus grandis grandis TaxID=2921223 RepID=UPI0021663EF7|nr:uncharacterized protein LOC126737026 [Anthonomus grandis grandis]